MSNTKIICPSCDYEADVSETHCLLCNAELARKPEITSPISVVRVLNSGKSKSLSLQRSASITSSRSMALMDSPRNRTVSQQSCSLDNSREKLSSVTFCSQDIIIGFDKSISMGGENKSEAANRAVLELLDGLDKPENKGAFRVALIAFGNGAEVIKPLSLVRDVKKSFLGIEPSDCATNITACLKKSFKVLNNREKREERQSLKPVVLLFTDGGHNQGEGPEGIAKEIKEICDLVTVGFGSDADLQLLQQIATTREHCYKCENGTELQKFLGNVGTTLSHTLSQGRNATQELSRVTLLRD